MIRGERFQSKGVLQTDVVKSSLRHRKHAIILIAIYLVAGFLSMEIGVRYLIHRESKWKLPATGGLHVPDSVVGYKLNPGRKTGNISINALGYRGRGFSTKKPEGTFRIVCSGNSITFGEAASADSTTYPAMLERIIRERGEVDEPVEVINAGVMGYTSRQCLLDLKTRLVALQPDLVLLCVGWNDITFSKYIGWTPGMTWQDPWRLLTLQGSYVFWFLNQRVLHIPARVRPDALRAFTDNLDSIISLCKNREIALAVVNPPTIFSEVMTLSEKRKCEINGFVPGEIPLFTAYVAAIEEVATLRDIPMFDSGLTYSVRGKDSLVVDVCHPNDAGYMHMVDVLYPQVRSMILKIMNTKRLRMGA